MDRQEICERTPEATAPARLAEAASPKADERYVLDHLRCHVDALRKHAPLWPKRRRVRALQEMLLEIKDVVLFAVDELEGIRSGKRISKPGGDL